MFETGTKSPLQSKTMVVNGVMGLCAFIALFWPGAEGLKQFIDAHASEIAMFWSVLNIVLRTVTKDKIALGD